LFIVKQAKENFRETLVWAIKNDVAGTDFLNELIRRNEEVRFLRPDRGPLGILPIPSSSNLGKELVNMLREHKDSIATLATSSGRSWLKKNIDDIIGQMLKISRGSPRARHSDSIERR